jgi:hypothetical protein
MVEPMNFEESERPPTKYGEGTIHIRQEHRGVIYYAVFDGQERVSDTVGPLDDEYIIAFKEGYEAAQ